MSQLAAAGFPLSILSEACLKTSSSELRSKRDDAIDKARRASSYAPIKRASFADQVYGHLFHKIITGELDAGDSLPSEMELSSVFKISRPVVRQALDRLRKDGLVKSRRGSGTFVKQRHPRNVQNLNSVEKIGELIENLEFRMVVEPESAFLAAQRRSDSDLKAMKLAVEEYNEVAVVNRGVGHHLDFAFHLAVATATANRRIVAGVRMVEFDIDHGVNLVRYLENYDHYERSKLIFAEHSRIFKAIESQDADTAKAAMRNHLELARIRMMNVQPGRGRPKR
jgi:GntR family transcriptional repressor for pyruvate dehydrogenase complex